MTESKISRKIICAAALVAIAVVAVFALAGCDSDPYAAKVNGVEIKESKITKQIENVRSSYSMTDNDSWGKYLAQSSMTPSSLRDQVLDSYIQQEIVKQYASEKDAVATDEQIDEQVKKVRDYYESDDEWKEALKNAGFDDENAYRDVLKYSIAYQNLEDKFAEEATVDDATILSDVQSTASTIDGGKKSSHILFSSDDEATAKEVLAKIKSGELDFAEAAKEYSTDTSTAKKGGNVGWDKKSTFVEAYTNALNNLNEGEVSDLVTSDYGIHIIKCTCVFHMPEKTDSLSDFPEAVIDDVRESDKETQGSTDLSNWIEEKKNEANIEKKDMPNGVSYNVDMSKYETSSSSDSSTDSSSSTSTDSSTDTSTDTSSSTGTSTESSSTTSTETTTDTSAEAEKTPEEIEKEKAEEQAKQDAEKQATEEAK